MRPSSLHNGLTQDYIRFMAEPSLSGRKNGEQMPYVIVELWLGGFRRKSRSLLKKFSEAS